MDSSAIILFSIITATSIKPGFPGEKESLHAYYKYSGLEATVMKYEREEVPQELKTAIGHMAWITHVITTREITITFRIP